MDCVLLAARVGRFKWIEQGEIALEDKECPIVGERPQKGIYAVLEDSETSEMMVIGTTHLIWSPKRGGSHR